VDKFTVLYLTSKYQTRLRILERGATTFTITTLSIMAFNTMTFSTMTLSKAVI
jgi:hypothetical protein